MMANKNFVNVTFANIFRKKYAHSLLPIFAARTKSVKQEMNYTTLAFGAIIIVIIIYFSPEECVFCRNVECKWVGMPIS